MEALSHEVVRSFVINELSRSPCDQWSSLVEKVHKRLIEAGQLGSALQGAQARALSEKVRELMWELLVKGVIVFGSDSYNPNFPFFRLTERGARQLADGAPVPYDPDGFSVYFKTKVPTADAVTTAYLEEAIATFNTGCLRASAVMLGCSSEALLQRLAVALIEHHPDEGHRAALARAQETLSINRRFRTLAEALAALTLRGDHADTVSRHLPGIFDLVRRQRNDAGHPSIETAFDELRRDEVFVTLRLFIDYARRIEELIKHLAA